MLLSGCALAYEIVAELRGPVGGAPRHHARVLTGRPLHRMVNLVHHRGALRVRGQGEELGVVEPVAATVFQRVEHLRERVTVSRRTVAARVALWVHQVRAIPAL